MFMKCDMIELFYDCDECISDDIVISFYWINKVILYCIVLYCIQVHDRQAVDFIEPINIFLT